MRFIRMAAMAALLSTAVVLTSSCGDTYRPIADPVSPPSGDPTTTDYVVVANSNGTSNASLTMIDVSGGTNAGNRKLGVGVSELVFGPSLATIYAPATGSDAVNYTTLSGTTGVQGTVTTRSLSTGSSPVSIARMYSTVFTSTYVVNSGYISAASDPTYPCPNTGSIREFDLSSNVAISHNICVGPTPVFAVMSSDAGNVFVLDSTGVVYVVNTKTYAVTNTITVGSNPVYAVMSLDYKYLYVLNRGDGSISVIDVNFEDASAAVVNTISTGGITPSFMALDGHYHRLYVANTGSNTISVFDLTTPKLPTVLTSGFAVGTSPKSIDILENGTKAYVANSGTNTVSVVQSPASGGTNFTLTKTIAVGTDTTDATTRANWLAASIDGSRVFVATTATGDLKNSTAVIDTATDSVLKNVAAPLQCDPSQGDTCTCNPATTSNCPLQRPVFVANRVNPYTLK